MEAESTEALIAQLAPGYDSQSTKKPANPTENIVAKRLLTKNSRKSRKPQGKNRGNPKKGGAGSKTVWGKPGCELGAKGIADDGDPNYDSEAGDDSFSEEPRIINEEQFLHEVHEILQEYFETGDVNEVADELRELENTKDYINYVHGIVSMSLEMALEHKPSHRELVSALLADICAAGIITKDHVVTGFAKIIRDLDDLAVDNPDAVETIGRFMARAVADNCLPDTFVKGLLEKGSTSVTVGDAAKVAFGLLSDRRQVFRLDGIWVTSARCSESVSFSEHSNHGDNSNESGGNCCGSPRSRNRFDSGSGATYRPRPVLLLIDEMQGLLHEYLGAGDCDELIRQLKTMDVPHFHHELIYELLLMMISKNKETALEAFIKLMAKLVQDGVVTQRQVLQAYRRLSQDFSEIEIDCPLAQQWIERYVQAAIDKNIHKREIFEHLPLKGRKRFCSEGDGGAVKN